MRINIIFLTMALSLLFGEVRANDRVEQWKIFELPFHLKVKGNPFDDVTVKATFINGADTVNVKGFYDGDDVYRVRFMPHKTGLWKYRISFDGINRKEKKGSFVLSLIHI